METACSALLAAYFAGMPLSSLDKTRVYEIPATTMARMNTAQRLTAKACASHYGIRYRIVESSNLFLVN